MRDAKSHAALNYLSNCLILQHPHTGQKESDNLSTYQSTYTIQSLLLPSHLLDGCIWDLTHLLKQCFCRCVMRKANEI